MIGLSAVMRWLQWPLNLLLCSRQSGKAGWNQLMLQILLTLKHFHHAVHGDIPNGCFWTEFSVRIQLHRVDYLVTSD